MALLHLACMLVALSLAQGDYITLEGHGSYELVTEKVTWYDARAACNKDDAHLAVFESKEEFDAVLAVLKDNITASGEEVYSGFHCLYDDGDWITLFDKPLITSGFSDWAYGNPVDEERCGSVCTNPDGLCSQNCESLLHYICKKKATTA